MKLSLFSFVLLILTLKGFCQLDSSYSYSVGINHSRGFIISHSPSMASLANRHISATELYIEQNTFGKKKWHARYNFLKIGMLFKYYQLNNKEQLGNSFSISPYFKFRLYSSDKFNLTFRPSIGLAFLGKKFNSENNFENIAIGSHTNMFISAMVEGEFKFLKKTNINLGIGLDHQSNTGFKTPNLGINMPYISAGINYDLGNKNEHQNQKKLLFKREPAYWHITGGIGLNEINPPNQKKFVAKSIAVTREKKMNFKSSIGYGLDFYYNPAQKAFLKQINTEINDIENIQIGVSIIHLLHFGRLSFTSQLSYYLKSKNEELGKIYHVFGGRYSLNKKLNLFFSGKTHIDKAEFIITGIGYRIN